MNNQYKITVPNPCHENWDLMTASEKGRFCDACATTVIDFTAMSSIEFQRFLTKNHDQKFCGNFNRTQLDAIHLSIPLQVIKKQYSFRKSFLLALLITMGTTLVNCTSQEGKQQKIENVEIIDTLVSLKDQKTTSDTIIEMATNTDTEGKIIQESDSSNTTIKKPSTIIPIMPVRIEHPPSMGVPMIRKSEENNS